jgi:hypothetical protein
MILQITVHLAMACSATVEVPVETPRRWAQASPVRATLDCRTMGAFVKVGVMLNPLGCWFQLDHWMVTYN